MRYLSPLLIALILAACETAKNSTDPEQTEQQLAKEDSTVSPNPITTEITEPQFGCYYELDDKYSDEQDSALVQQWWKEKITTIKKEGIQRNIFDHEGGGPNGAEWNANADLYFVILLPKDTIPNYTNFLWYADGQWFVPGNTQYDSSANGALIHYSVKKEDWYSYLRPVKEEDYEELYGTSADSIDPSQYAAPLNVGEVCKFTVMVTYPDDTRHTVSDFFHVAFGE